MKKAIISPRPQTVLRTGQSSSIGFSQSYRRPQIEFRKQFRAYPLIEDPQTFEDEDDDEYEDEYDCATRKHG